MVRPGPNLPILLSRRRWATSSSRSCEAARIGRCRSRYGRRGASSTSRRPTSSRGCPLCAEAAGEIEESLVVHRGETAFALLNKYPYSSGHLIVAPYAHVGELEVLQDATVLEIHRVGIDALAALRSLYRPAGFNLGWNIGRAAGAGIPEHVHLHIVPRWAGDTSFMPVLGDVKVVPEHLLATRDRLRAAWPAGHTNPRADSR